MRNQIIPCYAGLTPNGMHNLDAILVCNEDEKTGEVTIDVKWSSEVSGKHELLVSIKIETDKVDNLIQVLMD